MKELLDEYNSKSNINLIDLLDFRFKFECIHPFQDVIGRLTLFKECFKYNIATFIIDDNLKFNYYRELKEWNNEKGYLLDKCLTAQDNFKIKYND